MHHLTCRDGAKKQGGLGKTAGASVIFVVKQQQRVIAM